VVWENPSKIPPFNPYFAETTQQKEASLSQTASKSNHHSEPLPNSSDNRENNIKTTSIPKSNDFRTRFSPKQMPSFFSDDL
jgi:hypothetical protein